MKTGVQISIKSAKIVPTFTVKKCESTVVCLPDPEIKNISKGPLARGKARKSVKEMKKELEMRSLRRLTFYFGRKSKILVKNQPGKSN